MAPRFANIKFNLLRSIELFGDMNDEDMDVQAPPSSESYFKEHQLAHRLNNLLSQLIEDGFFEDCDLRDDDDNALSSDEDEDQEGGEDEEDGDDDDAEEPDDNEQQSGSEDDGQRQQQRRRRHHQDGGAGSTNNDQQDSEYPYNDSRSNSRSTPRSSGFSFDRRSSSSSRRSHPSSSSASRSHSGGGSRDSFSRRFKRWLGSSRR